MELEPANIAAYGIWGVALSNLKKYDEAIAKFRKVIELDPINATAYRDWAGVLMKQGKTEEAKEKSAMADKLLSSSGSK